MRESRGDVLYSRQLLLGLSGLERMPLGDGRARTTHHVFPVFHLRRPALPRQIDLAERWNKTERMRERDVTMIDDTEMITLQEKLVKAVGKIN